MNKSFDISDLNHTPQIIRDYLNKKPQLKSYYNLYPNEENIIIQAKNKLKNYKNRKVVYEEISYQMKSLDLTDKQKINLEYLKNNNSVCITTGHQLNLMTGPVYLIYKILQTIKLADRMNAVDDSINFVPIFWMASEDHDFLEINHFNLFNKQYTWEHSFGGAVGRLNLNGLENVFDDLRNNLKNKFDLSFINEFISSYEKSNNLSEATRLLIHKLFREFGILIIDGDSKKLKKLLIPNLIDEIENETSYKEISLQINNLKSNRYKIQVNPREINLFYLDNDIRTRIIKDKKTNLYFTDNSNKKWDLKDLIDEIKEYPERFSPNALLRPLYQEVILPNVAYIGGNAEIAYWLELKKYFESQSVLLPILIPRNSVFIIEKNLQKKMNKLKWEINNFFQQKKELIKKDIIENYTLNIDFEKDKKIIKTLYDKYKKEGIKTDKTFINLIKAQEYKQLKAFDKLEERLLKAEKKRQYIKVEQWENLYNQIFPKGKWQEREFNIFEWYLADKKLLTILYEQLCEINSKVHIINI